MAAAALHKGALQRARSHSRSLFDILPSAAMTAKFVQLDQRGFLVSLRLLPPTAAEVLAVPACVRACRLTNPSSSHCWCCRRCRCCCRSWSR